MQTCDVSIPGDEEQKDKAQNQKTQKAHHPAVFLTRERRNELGLLFYQRLPIAIALGLQLQFDDHGDAIVTWEYSPKFGQAENTTHGGIQAIMLESVCWFQAVSRHAREYWSTQTMTIHDLQPARRSNLTAKAQVIKITPHTAVVEAKVYNYRGEQVSHCTATLISRPLCKL